MPETLESILRLLCRHVEKTQQNALQTLYVLSDSAESKLAYDLLATTGLEVKYYAEKNGGKLYVQNQSLAANEARLAELLATAPLFKQIKELLDNHVYASQYRFSVANTPAGQQITLLLPTTKIPVDKISTVNAIGTSIPAPSSAESAKKSPSSTSQMDATSDSLEKAPAVARTAIPKSFKASASGDDPLLKRMMLYMSGRAFSVTAWVLLITMCLALVFSILVTIKGFLCPDVATDQRSIPSYCPKRK